MCLHHLTRNEFYVSYRVYSSQSPEFSCITNLSCRTEHAQACVEARCSPHPSKTFSSTDHLLIVQPQLLSMNIGNKCTVHWAEVSKTLQTVSTAGEDSVSKNFCRILVQSLAPSMLSYYNVAVKLNPASFQVAVLYLASTVLSGHAQSLGSSN